MVTIGKDLGLMRQVGTARIDAVDARQPVELGDLLRAEVLLDRHRIIGAALHRGIVAHDHHLAAGDARSEEHTYELQSLMRTSYAVFCLKKKRDDSTEHHVHEANYR